MLNLAQTMFNFRSRNGLWMGFYSTLLYITKLEHTPFILLLNTLGRREISRGQQYSKESSQHVHQIKTVSNTLIIHCGICNGDMMLVVLVTAPVVDTVVSTSYKT